MKELLKELKKDYNLSDELEAKILKALENTKDTFNALGDTIGYNQYKILKAFQKNQASDFHLNGSTGYGYGDTGRDVLELIYKDIFKGEKALVRANIASGTHALAIVLYGILRPKDKFISISGEPYDTLLQIIGKEKEPATLSELDIEHEIIDLVDNDFDDEAIKTALKNKEYKMVCIQRSRGYSLREALTIEKIERICKLIKEISPETIIFVDNCYGEFVEKKEPLEVGADIIAGSLIKNPGGGIAPRGGYIVGHTDFVNLCSYRLVAPGIGEDVGSALDFNRLAYQGLFMSPLIVEQALKGVIFAAELMNNLGYNVSPKNEGVRGDIVQAIILDDPDKLRKFCASIQSSSALDAHVRPCDSELPGYDDPVIMAGGTFIQGSSIEMSVDGPMRPPYIAYFQGGLSFQHVFCAIVKGVSTL